MQEELGATHLWGAHHWGQGGILILASHTPFKMAQRSWCILLSSESSSLHLEDVSRGLLGMTKSSEGLGKAHLPLLSISRTFYSLETHSELSMAPLGSGGHFPYSFRVAV